MAFRKRTLLAALALPTASLLFAEPATQPAMANLQAESVESLQDRLRLAKSEEAALPILKALAVRLKDNPRRVEPILKQVKEIENRLAANGKGVDAEGGIRTPHAALADGEVRGFALKELGNFDYDSDVGGNVPADVKALSGKTIRVRGFMIPIDQTQKITKFALVPDLFSCCFGQPPGLQHTMVVSAPAGKSVSYYPDELECTGTLSVVEEREDGYIVSLFSMNVSSVKPMAK